jgi:hypothetical protein
MENVEALSPGCLLGEIVIMRRSTGLASVQPKVVELACFAVPLIFVLCVGMLDTRL